MSDHDDGTSSLSLPPGIRLRTRSLVTAYVNHSKSTRLWITTINTKDRDTKNRSAPALKAFSFLSENEAKETAYVNAPPKMIPFRMSTHCFTCQAKFNSVFRRASHCRNCGVCICNSCSVNWHRTMVPETYNTKNSRVIKVCKACDHLSTSFRQTLLKGNYERANALYMTGNINLRCPFANVGRGEEIMLPVHCAVQGGNLRLVIWMVDIHHCPVKMINTGNKNNQMTSSLITTSKGRSVVDIAMENKSMDILKYLVNDKNISLSQGKEKYNSSLAALELLLKTDSAQETSKEKENEIQEQEHIISNPRTPKFSSIKKKVPRTIMKVQHNALSVKKAKENEIQEQEYVISNPRTPKFSSIKKTGPRTITKVHHNALSVRKAKKNEIQEQENIIPNPRTPIFSSIKKGPRTTTKVQRNALSVRKNCENRSLSFNFETPSPPNTMKPPPLPMRSKAMRRIPASGKPSETISKGSEPEKKSKERGEKRRRSTTAIGPKRNPSQQHQRFHANAQIPIYYISGFGNDCDSEDLDNSDEDLDNSDEDLDDSDLDFDFDDEESVATTVEDKCTICDKRSIDCVFPSCGHQVCCLTCSKSMSMCPMCNSKCQAIRIFRP